MSPTRSSDGPVVAPAFEESIEELYEMAPCGYLTTTLDGRIVKVNRTLAQWLGYSDGELTAGKAFVDLLTVGGKIFCETHFNLMLRMQDSVDEIAFDLVCKDGRILPSLVNARQKRTPAGEPVLNRFTVFNATERRMYERQLVAARDLLQTTLASIGDGVIATDADARITFMNPVAEELTGWKNDAAAGKPVGEILKLVHEATGVTVENPVERAMREDRIVDLDLDTVLCAKNGQRIPVDDSGSPIRDAAGKTVGGVIVFRDISAARAAEKALREAHEQLENSAADLRRSNEDLSQFAYAASHDLRSPLNTVVNFAQLLTSEYGAQLGEGQQLLGYMAAAASRMRTLIDDLLSYATASGAQPAGQVDANASLHAVLENLRGQIQESGAVITYDPLPVVSCTETSVGQVFQNLIANAINYRGAEPPRIHISAEPQGESWRFSCKDNGIGIAPQYQAQIFQAFRRLHGSERPGSGIGLALCRKVMERCKGSIWVESQPGQGSTFFFTLPRA